MKLLPPKRISCGHQFTLAATDSGDLYGWGDNHNAKLGPSTGPESVWYPTKIPREAISGIVNDVSCGSEFSMCILLTPGDISTETGVLLGWGVNSQGQVGVSEEGENLKEVRIPTQVKIAEKVSRVSCGSDFAACISASGKLYTWGRGNNGNLGHGNTDSQLKPIVNSLSDQIIISISLWEQAYGAITNSLKFTRGKTEVMEG